MAPKKAAAASKKASAPAGTHATYQDMIKDAVIQLKDRQGSSRQALKKYVKANNSHLKDVTDNAFTARFNQALSKGSEAGVFERPKGPSGPVKLGKGKKEAKPAAPAEKKAAPKTATKAKTAATKKAAPKTAAPKKAAATKKTAATKAAPKKTSTKANTSKARKTPTVAPAVEDKPTVLTKTKSGRVAKTKAPAATKKATTKKAAPKKTAATPKKAATKKSATPKA